MRWSRHLAIAYCAFQSAMLLVYWAWLFVNPAAQSLFVPAGAPRTVLIAFAAPDLLLYFTASTVTAIGLMRHARWTIVAAALHAGAAVYAALYATSFVVLDPAMGLGALLMSPALVGPPLVLWLAIAERRE
jgi:citrate lyase beta subunit